jgi:hypothetical protein
VLVVQALGQLDDAGGSGHAARPRRPEPGRRLDDRSSTTSAVSTSAAGASDSPDSYAASLAFSSSFSAIVLRHSTTISSRKSSTSSGSKPSLNRTCWNCFVTTSSGVKAMVFPLSGLATGPGDGARSTGRINSIAAALRVQKGTTQPMRVTDRRTKQINIVSGKPRSRATGPIRNGGMSRRKKPSGGSVTV